MNTAIKRKSTGKGMAYCANARTMDLLKQNGKTTILVFHPMTALWSGAFKNCDNKFHCGLSYCIRLCTDDLLTLQSAIDQYYASQNMYPGVDYSYNNYPSRTHNKERNAKYPITLALNIGFRTDFNLKNLKSILPENFNLYASSIFNNGIVPTSNFWFDIPDEFKEKRCKVIKENHLGDQYFMSGIREHDKKLLISLLKENPNYPVHYRYGFNPLQKEADTINPDFSVRIFGTQIDEDIRPHSFGTCKAEVLDCLRIKNAADYKELMGIEVDDFKSKMFNRIAISTTPYIFEKTWMTDFVKYRRGNRSVNTTLGEDAQNIIISNMLVQVIEVTVNS